jgi:hypothetical protein
MLPNDTLKPAFLVSQRTRLSATFKSDKIKALATIQDARIWGSEVPSPQVGSAISPRFFEASVEVQLSKRNAVRVGRQQLVYDDHRLLGSSDWDPNGRSHDAVLLAHEGNKISLHLGGAYNQNNPGSLFGTTYSVNNYKALAFLWGQLRPNNALKVSVTVLGDAFQGPPINPHAAWRLTSGVHAELSPSSWILKGTGYYQNGRTVLAIPIHAWMAAASVEHKRKWLSVTAGIDALSGTDASTINEYQTFHTLYATNHRFYGTMDYFLNIPADTRLGGLLNVVGKVAVNLSEQSKLTLDAHYLRLMADISDPRDVTFLLPRDLATELDLAFLHKITNEASVQLGYSVLLPREGLIGLQMYTEANTAHWAWVMLTVKPSVVISK